MNKILIVDDELDICTYAAEFLQRRGYTVFPATSPKEALRILEEEKPQVMLLDIVMEEMSGLEVLRQVKQISPNTKVIMVTVLWKDDIQQEARALGADGYIRKPYVADQLEKTVADFIASCN